MWPFIDKHCYNVVCWTGNEKDVSALKCENKELSDYRLTAVSDASKNLTRDKSASPTEIVLMHMYTGGPVA